MTYRVHELELAQADIRHIVDWLRKRSPQGALAWLDAYDDMIAGLAHFVGHGLAAESMEADFKVQQVLFKTRHGNVYRAFYTVDGQNVYILRVRGKGQAEVRPGQLGRP